jgi:[protein-PII] uridylyltransferase
VGTRERRERSDASDRELIDLFHSALAVSGITERQIALAAVGGFGRGELSPGSDLDILFTHIGLTEKSLSVFIKAMLNPLWNLGRQIDYSVRTGAQTKAISKGDIKVVFGLLDIRHIVGNQDLTTGVARTAVKQWRRRIRNYLPMVRESIDLRSRTFGELAFLLEPDLKESRGGLRDINAIRALAKSGFVAVSLDRLAAAEALLSAVREILHGLTGRSRDQLLLTEQDAVAAAMGFADADILMLEISKAARSVDYVMQMMWTSIEDRVHRISLRRSNWSRRTPIAKGLERFRNEISVVDGYDIASDPGIGLRAAAIAAQRGVRISLESILRIAKASTELPDPWPRQSREDLVAFIGAGTEMIDVFESLDQEGLISKWIPEWEHVRFLPQRNVLHHHTVDRHMLETASRAASLTREVHRPDLLLVGALFHDIGKGYLGRDHSEFGAELIAPMARRMGFSASDVLTLSTMVLQHLLIPTVATRRDLEDPQTIEYVLSLVDSAGTLELLHALSIADGEATGRTAWSDWKAGLVANLVSRTLSAMSGVTPAPQPELSAAQLAKVSNEKLSLEIFDQGDVFDIEIVAPDRVGLLSAITAVFTVARIDVRSAKTRTINRVAVMNWIVTADINVPAPSREGLLLLIERALIGTEDLKVRIDERIRSYRRRPGILVPPPVVSAITEIVTDATIIEVRMHDRPALLYTVATAISEFGIDIRGAIVSTLGAEAFDTLYVTDLSGAPLGNEQAHYLANRLEIILSSEG